MVHPQGFHLAGTLNSSFKLFEFGVNQGTATGRREIAGNLGIILIPESSSS